MRGLVFVLVLGFSFPAAADPRPDVGAAKAHFAAGTSFFSDKRYREAIDEFLKAYRLSSAPDLLYNLGVCYDAMDDAGRATFYFRRYLEVDPDAAERAKIEASIARLAPHVGALVLHPPPHVGVNIDGVQPEAPPPTPLPMTAGRHRIKERRGQDPAVNIDVTIAAGMTSELTLPPPIATVPASRPRATTVDVADGPKLRPAGIALLVVGGAAVVGGIIGSALAQNAGSDVSHEVQTGGTFDPAIERRGHDAVIASGVMYGVGGAALVAGTILTVLGGRVAKTTRSLAVTPFASTTGAGVSIRVSF